MTRREVFLDHQSTTPVDDRVLEAMIPFFREAYGNPASLHHFGLRVRDAMQKAREQVAAFINAESAEEIFFTSGGTESSNLAVKGVAYANQRKGTHVVVSATEHPSVLQSVEFLEKQGFTASRVPVSSDGIVDPAAVAAAITDRTVLVAVHLVNHDIAAIQPVQEIGRITQEKGIPYYVDAVAAAGWVPVDVQAIGCNLLSLSPHRFYGPKGVGVLYRNRKARIVSVQHGGVQEGGRRAGTENVPGIVGCGVACELALAEIEPRVAHVARLQRRLNDGLHARIPYIRLNGPAPGPLRAPNSLNYSTEFIEGEGQLLSLDMMGIAVASGSSCVSKSLKISHVLAAIGLDHALAQGNLIMSLGRDNTDEDVDYVVENFARIVDRLRAMSPMWQEFQEGKIDSVIAPTGRGMSFTEHAAAISGKPAH
jgi:cysteine desulfurase